MPASHNTFGLSALELARIAPLPEASHLSGLSEDTLRREYGHKFVKLSDRRVGMRVRDALMLSAESAVSPSPNP
jgi:hypothetical protein